MHAPTGHTCILIILTEPYISHCTIQHNLNEPILEAKRENADFKNEGTLVLVKEGTEWQNQVRENTYLGFVWVSLILLKTKNIVANN